MQTNKQTNKQNKYKKNTEQKQIQHTQSECKQKAIEQANKQTTQSKQTNKLHLLTTATSTAAFSSKQKKNCRFSSLF